MKAMQTFLFTAALTAGFMLSGMLIGDADEKLLAKPVGIATLGETELTGRLVDATDGVYAILTATRPEGHATTSEQTYSYCVSYMPPSSPMSRMMVIPSEVKRGQCSIPAGSGVIEERILIQKHPEVKPVETNAFPALVGILPQGVGTWSLAVSRSETVPGLFAGAVAPSVTPNRVELGDGALVLAAYVPESVDAGKVPLR